MPFWPIDPCNDLVETSCYGVSTFFYGVSTSKNKKYIMDEKQKNQINIELTEEMAGGVYSNLAIITHSPTEFVLDFVSLMPGAPKAKVKSRIVMTPQHAKRLFKALADNISKYESSFGTIKEVGNEMMPPFTMGGPKAQA